MTTDQLDTLILRAIGDDTLRRAAILERVPAEVTLPQFYAAIRRLVDAGKLEPIGRMGGRSYRRVAT